MTILINRPSTAATASAAANSEAAPRAAHPAAPRRREGTYTARYDLPQAAPRPRGSYVSAAGQSARTPGSYTWVDGTARGVRREGSYTGRG